MKESPEYTEAIVNRLDKWVPACGGLEQPFKVRGRTLLYCFNPAKHAHAYLDCDTDLILSSWEARTIFQV